ncbi:hypothetical protein J6590_044639 [Homalodisca vitripennis]|nr:hypothetical protein J6590_044639 [Homalodisca vitripennis]
MEIRKSNVEPGLGCRWGEAICYAVFCQQLLHSNHTIARRIVDFADVSLFSDVGTPACAILNHLFAGRTGTLTIHRW